MGRKGLQPRELRIVRTGGSRPLKVPRGKPATPYVRDEGLDIANAGIPTIGSNGVNPEDYAPQRTAGMVYSLERAGNLPPNPASGLEAAAEEFDGLRAIMELSPGNDAPVLPDNVSMMGGFTPYSIRRDGVGLDAVANIMNSSYRDGGIERMPGSIGRIGEPNPIPKSGHLYEHSISHD